MSSEVQGVRRDAVVSSEEVAQVARLARLELNGAELERMARELSAILEHVRELQNVRVLDTSASADVIEWPAPLRDDVVGPDPLETPVAELSRDWQNGFFTVPRLAALDQETAP